MIHFVNFTIPLTKVYRSSMVLYCFVDLEITKSLPFFWLCLLLGKGMMCTKYWISHNCCLFIDAQGEIYQLQGLLKYLQVYGIRVIMQDTKYWGLVLWPVLYAEVFISRTFCLALGIFPFGILIYYNPFILRKRDQYCVIII